MFGHEHSTSDNPIIAAAGPAFLVWILGGGAGLALLVFVMLKVVGK